MNKMEKLAADPVCEWCLEDDGKRWRADYVHWSDKDPGELVSLCVECYRMRSRQLGKRYDAPVTKAEKLKLDMFCKTCFDLFGRFNQARDVHWADKARKGLVSLCAGHYVDYVMVHDDLYTGA